jgi:pimeloyl-ACP methyl ester carboxylesterase
MSAPFAGAPGIRMGEDPVHAQLLALDSPRKHYQWYYSEREAAGDMLNAPQGFHAFLRAYFHMKSADWAENVPEVLSGWTASELARLPTYYVMQASENMAETVAPHDPGKGSVWMPEADMAVFAAEFARTGLQGALNWYRCATSQRFRRDLSVFNGRRIEGPAMFISGASDWGYRQVPGAYERMPSACADFRGSHLVEGAGHWVQQEQPDAVVALLRAFFAET